MHDSSWGYCLFLFLFVAYEHSEAPSKVGKKIRRTRNRRMREAIGADQGFSRAHQSQFAGYLFAVLVLDFTWKKGCHVVQNNSTHEDVILCREITSLACQPSRFYKVIWTECKLFFNVL